jgi:hypothetical protein
MIHCTARSMTRRCVASFAARPAVLVQSLVQSLVERCATDTSGRIPPTTTTGHPNNRRSRGRQIRAGEEPVPVRFPTLPRPLPTVPRWVLPHSEVHVARDFLARVGDITWNPRSLAERNFAKRRRKKREKKEKGDRRRPCLFWQLHGCQQMSTYMYVVYQ